MKLPNWVNTAFSTPTITDAMFNMNHFKEAVEKIRAGNKDEKIEKSKTLLSLPGMINHHQDKNTKCVVMAVCKEFEYPHEHQTAKRLTAVNYNVILLPTGYFNRWQKKHDVFLIKNHIFLEADLKCLSSTKNIDTIGKNIKRGSEQAKTLVVDVQISIERKKLIEGLRSGCVKNDLLSSIYLFYNSRFYELPKSKIMSNKIFDTLK